MDQSLRLPSGKLTVCYGKSPFLMGSKSIISMAIFNSKLCVYQGVIRVWGPSNDPGTAPGDDVSAAHCPRDMSGSYDREKIRA